ncbi:MAG: hypothetical protein CO184_01600 [Candidatus Zambryskibacteria bacterium CG_4_9_14_3_um_filter_40_16]|uniref:Uncharacterized protein n=2 Tax=Candidatus Zambryskiibacteriota TaxID=1817925 RepID=A0A2H0K6D1_9BACT|nr:MAG: hypothetical protein COV95_02180 [Candidatus Zambryskibacteria bacterium CG11_big_fil_rev_8_21_14_0_20_40_24]PJA33544.1 MAG: hypothetical protein CO184_01600 [Candidatus Zambryskibacteria bacterium CG_4_9_14_3_um_filter_40_16]
MKYKKKLNILASSSLIVFVLSSFLMSPIRSGLCGETDVSCGNFLGDSIGMPLFTFSFSFFVLFTILRWLSEPVFKTWWRFAKYYTVVAAVLITLSPTIDGSIFGFDKEFMSWFLASIFLLTSLILIARKWWQIRKSDSHILNR